MLEKWIKVFGAESTTIVTSDASQQGALYDRFEELLGLTPKILVRETGTGLNRSLLWDEISLILEVNRNYPKDGRWNEHQTFIKHGVIDKLSSIPAASKNPPNTLRTPAAHAEQIAAIALDELTQLKNLNVRVIGDRAERQPGGLAVGENLEVKHIDIAKVAAFLERQDFGAVSSIAPRPLVRNWLPYLKHEIPTWIFRGLKNFIR